VTRRCLAAVLITLAALTAAGDIRTLIAQKQVAGDPICSAQTLPLFYERRAYQPAWSDDDARAMIAAIERAPEDGLRSADYHREALGRLQRGDELDVLLSDAFLLLAGHLLAGRVDPLTIEPTWCLEPRTYDLVSALETALETHDVRGTLAMLAPAHEGYRRLREELARLRAVEATGGWERVDDFPTLVLRLAATDDVTAAVRHFQHLHGLTEDGIVGPLTLRELNVPVADRIRQVELNLERWRWLPATLGERYAIINIAEFELRVVEAGKEVLAMHIVVGKDYQQTPIFSSRITQVVFSPYWNVPESIAAKELRPKGPQYLQREHIEVLSKGRLRQTPGPWNSLGLLKFNLPNRYSVYLHDTPARDLFGRSSRAFSHGCMRIEKPVDLAQYLLPHWTRDEIVTASRRGTEHAVEVKNPLPVHVLYWTAFVGEDDELHFAPDVYGRDAALERATETSLRP